MIFYHSVDDTFYIIKGDEIEKYKPTWWDLVCHFFSWNIQNTIFHSMFMNHHLYHFENDTRILSYKDGILKLYPNFKTAIEEISN